MTSVEKLNVIFARENFFVENKELSSLDEILKVVHMEYPEITAEELSDYLLLLSNEMHKLDKANDELCEDDLEAVAGGITLATILLIGAAGYAGYKAGEKIGEFIYNIASSRKK